MGNLSLGRRGQLGPLGSHHTLQQVVSGTLGLDAVMSALPGISQEVVWEGRGLSAFAAFYYKLVRACITRTPVWLYIACLVPPALVLTVVFMQPYVHPSLLLSDPAYLYFLYGAPDHAPMYYGFVTNLGILIWSSAIFICLFVGLLLYVKTEDIINSFFMLASGFLTTILVVDDFFMVHETVFPYITGLDESYLVAIYALFFIIYLTIFNILILRSHGILLFFALSFFAISVIVDKAVPSSKSDFFWFLEDGMKLFGIFAWVTFYLRTAWELLAPAPLVRDH